MKKIFLILFVFFLFSLSCQKNETRPASTPFLEFRSITQEESAEELYANYLSIKTYFTDGDMDLGLNGILEEDKQFGLISDDPDTPEIDTIPNPLFYNYFITGYKRENGIYKEFLSENARLNLNGRFPRLSEDRSEVLQQGPFVISKHGRWKGEIEYKIRIGPGFINEVDKDSIKFKVSILDRAKNKSNDVVTKAIVVLD